MKKLLFEKVIIVIFLSLLLSAYYLLPSAYAVSTSPTPSQNTVPDEGADLEKIQRIKDLVASKVAELNLVEKRGIIGTVREVTNMSVVITDLKGNSRQIDVDELTKFDIAKTSSGISDLEVGQTYSFVGLYNKDTEKLLARTINNTETIPVYFEGALVSIDDDEFQLTVVSEKGEERKVDIENSTRTNLISEEGELTRSGFSKLETNQRILAIGFWDTKDDTLLTATRVIHFETVPPSKQMQSHIQLEEAATAENSEGEVAEE